MYHVLGVTGYTLCGTIPTPLGLFLNFLFGSMTLAALIACRSLISKSVPSDEATKVFSVITVCDVLLPLIASSVYGGIFTATIDTYPTLVFHISALANLIALMGFIYMDLKFFTTSHESQVRKSS